jgi:hypothetical protein
LKVRVSGGTTFTVQAGNSIVFLTPSVINPICHARFYDDAGELHEVPATDLISIDADAEVAALRADLTALRHQVDIANVRLGPRAETPEEIAARTQRLVDVVTAAASKSEAPKMCTTSGEPVDVVRAKQTAETGQHDAYIVLCDEERAKGFVRPYRDAYKHVGPPGNKYPLRDLTAEELLRYPLDVYGYTKFEEYPDGSTERAQGKTGKFWQHAILYQTGKGCGTVTTMGRKLSETYARDPKFYGSTFCCGCNRHLPVAEFVWTADNARVGS